MENFFKFKEESKSKCLSFSMVLFSSPLHQPPPTPFPSYHSRPPLSPRVELIQILDTFRLYNNFYTFYVALMFLNRGGYKDSVGGGKN